MKELLMLTKIADGLKVSAKQVNATVELLDEGATIPFISRYRKEVTGGLDEVQVQAIKNEIERLRDLETRRESILKSIESQDKLTDELRAKIEAAENSNTLEDLYLPYKPKRKTKASVAREKGLEPLAAAIFKQELDEVEVEATNYINTELGVNDTEDALMGAQDIIAEWVSEDAVARENIRNFYKKTALIRSRVVKNKEDEGEKYSDYFEWEEPLMNCPSHRMLAMRRGEDEGMLRIDIVVDEEQAHEMLKKQFISKKGECANQIELAIEDGFKRLLSPSIELDMRVLTKLEADKKAIEVFADNLRELLLASPIGEKRILGIDPGFRTGCKVVALNAQGKLLEDTVIYPHEPQKQKELAETIILAFCEKHKIEAIAIGNGTASRETEQFVRGIAELPKTIVVVMVNEAGASVYSASEVAREEFPTYDLTVRGAVSIGRRLADPLAELVKIDPKSIGVGQYQHDVDQAALKRKLDEVVISCVNAVGVELNTASKQLLSYVSGINETVAKNIVDYRNANGAFKSRRDLLKVARMGEKIFEQCSGFLRIRDAVNPLDKSAVHPESYSIVEKMAKDLNCSVADLIANADLRKKINPQQYVTDKVGLPTLMDIVKELEKPGRDPRKEFEIFNFDENVHEIKDLREGMRLPGIVTNVTNFGAFVDIGVHQDGLVHLSQLSNTFVDDPNKVVKVGQKVWVTVTEVDEKRKRIALSMKGDNGKPTNNKAKATTGKPQSEDYSKANFSDALSALKDKFGSR